MTRPAHTRLISLLCLLACEPEKEPDACHEGEVESDCVEVDQEEETWTEEGEISEKDEVITYDIESPFAGGEGVVEAVLTFEAYDGQPRLDLRNLKDDETIASAISLEPDDPDFEPELRLTWEMTADQTATLQVAEFLSSIEPEDYPVAYTLELTWVPTPDCWEDNDSADEAARMPANMEHEAWLSGAISDDTLRDVDEDWYVVELPDGATEVAVTLGFAEDGIVPSVEIYADAGDTLLTSVSAYEPDGETLEVETPATDKVWVRVLDRFGVEYAYGEPFDPSGTERPSHFDEPYTLRVDAR